MRTVLLDFNGTMFFDSSLHQEAWSKIYRELYPADTAPIDTRRFCGPCNDAILQNLAPWLTPEQRRDYSWHKEALYRDACLSQPQKPRLVAGTEAFLDALKEKEVPFILASASIIPNIEFFFDTFALGRWFDIRTDVVYDDGTYPDKGAMHLEAARRRKVSMADCLVIEDSASSIRHAKQNGAGCIIAIGETADPDQLLEIGADHYIRDFSEFDFAWLEA